MKAAVYTEYGPSHIRIDDVEKPVPKDDEVLIAVRASSVNPVDWHLMEGTPYIGRIAMGLRRPRSTRLGVDVAGRVEAVGRNVTRFKPGDEVFGACRGAFAEFATARESWVVAKPRGVSFEQAATVAVAAGTAMQGLCGKAHLRAGQKVLINGAAGGVGTFAVQISKSLGAVVTGVCSTANVEMVRSIGADHVIDYTREDFTKSGERYDVFLDCMGNHPLAACKRLLEPAGIYLMVGGSKGKWIDPMPRAFAAPLFSLFSSKRLLMYLAKPGKDDTAAIAALLESGKVTPVIDRRYPLNKVAEALEYLERGHARGKVVITIA